MKILLAFVGVLGFFTAHLQAADRYHLSISGQSNAQGVGTPSTPLTTSQPYDNLRRTNTTAVALIETTRESVASALANFITASAGQPDGSSIVHNWSVSNTAYSGLKKGTAAYSGGLQAVTDSRTAINTLRPSDVFLPGALFWIHGESDEGAGASSTTYQGYLNELQLDWETDVVAALSLPAGTHIPLIVTQYSAWTRLTGAGNPKTEGRVAIGQWLAARDNPHIYLACPTYHLPHSGDVHYTNVGHRRLGRYLGRAAKKILVDGEDWRPLQIASAIAVGNVITLELEGGDGSDIVVDTTRVTQRGHFYGFEYTDPKPNAPSIQSVAISGPRTIEITLSRSAREGGIVSYGKNGAGSVNPGPTLRLAPGGNIRDQDSTPSGDGDDPLYNWLVISEVPVQTSATIPEFSNTQSIDSTGAAGSMVHAGKVPSTSGASRVTWSFYVRSNSPTTWPSQHALWSQASANQRHYDFRTYTGGVMRFFLATSLGDASNYYSTTGWSAGAWHHVVVAFDNGTITVYRNKTLLSGTQTGTVPATLTVDPKAFMAFLNSADAYPANFNMAHAAMWVGTAFNQTQINELDPNTDPLLHSAGAPTHYWPLQGTYEDLGTAIPSRSLLPYGGISFEAIAP